MRTNYFSGGKANGIYETNARAQCRNSCILRTTFARVEITSRQHMLCIENRLSTFSLSLSFPLSTNSSTYFDKSIRINVVSRDDNFKKCQWRFWREFKNRTNARWETTTSIKLPSCRTRFKKFLEEEIWSIFFRNSNSSCRESSSKKLFYSKSKTSMKYFS